MFKFAIVDDSIDDLKIIESNIKEHFDFHNLKCSIDLYNNPLDYNYDNVYDAVFIDIDMPDMNGIELAKIIISKINTKIIFITNYNEYISAVFNVQPFHYIRKSNIKFESIKVLTLLLKKINKERIKVKSNGDDLLLLPNDIIYITKDNNLTLIVTKEKEYVIWETITSLHNRLMNYDIEKINQSTLINLKYVKNINDNKIVLNNGKTFNISVRTKKKFKLKYEEFLLRSF